MSEQINSINKLAIITCGDEKYFLKDPYAPIVALTSYRNHFGNTADYFCLSNFLDKKTDDIIQKNGFKKISLEIPEFNKNHTGYGLGSYPPECCYWCKIPEILLSLGYEYAMFVDGDTYCNSRFDIPEKLKSVHLCAVYQPSDDFVVNSGVVFFNNRKCVNDNFFENAVDKYKNNEYPSDQELLNQIILEKKYTFGELDISFNFAMRHKTTLMKSSLGVEMLNFDKKEDIKIAHFIASKPWLPVKKEWDFPIQSYFVKLYSEIKIWTPRDGT